MKTINKTYKSNTYEYTLKIIFTDDIVAEQKKIFKKWNVFEEADDVCSIFLIIAFVIITFSSL